MLHAGAVEPLGTIRARRCDKFGADALDGAGNLGVPAPEHDNAVALQRAEFLRCTERDRTTADNDHHGVVKFGHGRCLGLSVR